MEKHGKHIFFGMDFMFLALTQVNTYASIYLRSIYIYIQISRVRGFGGFRFGDFGSRLTCDLGFHRVF